jgi:hypothetical protein
VAEAVAEAPARPPATYSSMPPPVVATVITPLSTVLDAPARAGSTSWRAVVGGTVIGLAVVAAFVVGARLGQAPPSHDASPAAAAPPPPAVRPLPAASPVATATTAPVVPELRSTPVVAATSLPLAPPPARWNPPVAAPRGATAPARTPTVIAAATPAPAPAPSAAPAASAAPAVDEGATSLVPVIPASAPPEADPLVKAVKQDIEEEQKERGTK